MPSTTSILLFRDRSNLAYRPTERGIAEDIQEVIVAATKQFLAKEIVYASFILATAGQLALLISIFTHLRSSEAAERSASWLNLIVATLLSTVPPYLL